MKIAFMHYHLKTGGVTTVLKHQIEAVIGDNEVMVLTGEPADFQFPVDVINIPGLGYDGSYNKGSGYKEIAASVIKAITLHFNGPCDLLHVHNPLLAKNKNFLKILMELKKNHVKLFLQIHDFAEDGRPLSYFSREEYPPDCHYGVINSRDYEVLIAAGLTHKGLHEIPNTFKSFDFYGNKKNVEASVLYPVRAIRRKNIGEAILLSLFFKNKERLCITLPPNSPDDIKSHNSWKNFVKKNNLNVEFEAGLKTGFTELMRSAEFLITTSITEGFGFSFLEPWVAGKILWGRKLPSVCYDFEKNGVNLDHLYSSLKIPVGWIGDENLYERWNGAVRRNSLMFNFSLTSDKIKHFYQKITENNNIDFGLLDELFQKQVIRRVLSGKKYFDELLLLNPFIILPGNISGEDDLIANNMISVKNCYSSTKYGKRLADIYSKVINNVVSQKIDKKILVSKFFKPNEFSLLKWGEYIE